MLTLELCLQTCFFVQYLCSNIQISHFYCIRYLHVHLFPFLFEGGQVEDLW